MDEPVVSVIVPVRNGGEHVRGLVDALAAQTVSLGRFELLVGDDGSTDGALLGLEARHPWLRVLPGPPLNSYAARNRAARAARGAVLAFSDVDCRPEPGWLEAGRAALEDGDVAAGRVRLTPPERPTVWTLLEAETTIDHEAQVRAGLGATANLFLRRDLLERLGGFDEGLPSGGDWDLVRRCAAVGARLVYAPDAVVLHSACGGRVYLRKAWFRARWAGTRAALAGGRPDLLAALAPQAALVMSRRRGGRPLGLDRRRLAEYGLEPGLTDQVVVFGLRYVVIPSVVYVARVWGWADGLRRRWTSPRIGAR